MDNYTALKQVSLMITEPSLTQLGSWRLTAVLHVTVETWIGHAAAVLSGAWGAVTRRAQHSGSSRTTVYPHAQRVVQAVASAQASGISDDALWHENERLKAENDALWQAWSDAEERSEAKQRDVAGTGCAMGLRLSQIVTLCAIVLPRGAVPSRAMRGRWVQEAAAQAGRRLVVLDLACQARVRVRCLDEIFLHREPVLMAIGTCESDGTRGAGRTFASLPNSRRLHADRRGGHRSCGRSVPDRRPSQAGAGSAGAAPARPRRRRETHASTGQDPMPRHATSGRRSPAHRATDSPQSPSRRPRLHPTGPVGDPVAAGTTSEGEGSPAPAPRGADPRRCRDCPHPVRDRHRYPAARRMGY